jgi:hypothetical protein
MNNSDKKPSTREEAIAWIISQLSESQKDEIRSMELQDFLVDSHFSLGMWIRNQLFYGNPQRERLEGTLMDDSVSLHADDLSRKLLEDVWKVLKE